MHGVIQPLALLTVILAGYLLKRLHVFGPRDYRVLQSAVFDLTLPGAIVYSFTVNEHHLSMLWISLFGMLASTIPLLLIYEFSRRMPVSDRAFLMLNGCGMNVENFCLPVITGLRGQGSAMPVLMFDIGNSVMMCAGMYAMTTTLLHIPGGKPIDPSMAGSSPVMPYVAPTDPHARRLQRLAIAKGIVRSFAISVPFDTYALMLTLMLLGIRLPQWVGSFAEPLSNANGFCSMLMVGMLTELPSTRVDARNVLNVIGWKALFAVLLGMAAWYLLPFDADVRHAVVLVCLAPTAVFSTLFTDRVLGNAKLAGFTLASTGVLSLAAITVTNLLL